MPAWPARRGCASSTAILLLALVLLPPATAWSICSTARADCGLSPREAQTKYLSTYEQLRERLSEIAAAALVPVSVGPLIAGTGGKSGLVDIDVPLDKALAPAVNVDICGADNAAPTIRDAVVCSVTADAVQPPRGNADASRIGASTHGRPLLAARLGAPGKPRVFVVTQQHGNEAAATESALNLLQSISQNPKSRLVTSLDLLFVLRANPDGGEPSAQGVPPFGQPYASDSGFFRFTVDAAAGGGFIAPSEPGFFGSVGRGYDMNRYNYGGLQAAIRPVESQALVAAVLAFRPALVLDLHGDAQKFVCRLDAASARPPLAPGLPPTVRCAPPAPPVPTLLGNRRRHAVMSSMFADDPSVLSGEQFAALRSGPAFKANVRLVRSLAAMTVRRARRGVDGKFVRYSQFSSSGAQLFTDGSVDRAAHVLGAIGTGWEVTNFVPQLRLHVSGLSFANGSAVPEIGAEGTDSEPCFLVDNICMHRRLLYQALHAYVRLASQEQPLRGDGGYCAVPLADALLFDLPASPGAPPGLATDGAALVPEGGQLGVPTYISGVCAGDVSV